MPILIKWFYDMQYWTWYSIQWLIVNDELTTTYMHAFLAVLIIAAIAAGIIEIFKANQKNAKKDEGANPTKTQDEYNEERDIQRILSMVPSKEDIGKQIRSQVMGGFQAPKPKDTPSEKAKKKN